MPKSAKKSKTVDFVTPWFTARYPKISKPDTKGKYADGKFKTDGLLDDDGIKVTEKALKSAAAKLWPDVPFEEISLPLKTFYDSKEDKEKGEAAGRGITLKSQYKPAIYDSKKKKLPDGVEIGGGSVIRVASAIYGWSKSAKVKVKDAKGKTTIEDSTEYGLGLRLGDVQVRELVEYKGGSNGEAFDDVDDEDAFVYDGEGDDVAGADQFDDAGEL